MLTEVFGEALDLIGAISIALTLAAGLFAIGRKVGSIEQLLKIFVPQNHADHERIIEQQTNHTEKLDDHADRLARVETKVDESCD